MKRAHRWIQQHSGRRLIILKYHRATGGDLRRQMLYLSRYYRVLPLEAALEELYAPCKEEKQAHDQRIPLVLTFDDGYRDNYTYAFAAARELQVPITIFLIPGYIESCARFWWLESEYLVYHASVGEVTIEGCTYCLKQPEQRKALSQAIDAHLRYAGSVAQREAFLADIRKALAVPVDVTEEEDAALPLTWGEVRKMQESGWVSFGAHTMHHPILACLTDAEEMRWEVEECRRVLEKQLGHAVHTFAYPIGSPKNIGAEGLRAVKTAGYEWALTTIEEVSTPQTDPHLLKRLSGNENTHWLVMASEMVGLLRIVSRLRKKLGKSFFHQQS